MPYGGGPMCGIAGFFHPHREPPAWAPFVLKRMGDSLRHRGPDDSGEVVMNRCVKIEHGRFFGGINFLGVNRRLISSKKS